MSRLAPSYPLETERLLLRPVDPAADAEAMLSYRALPEVCRYIPPVPATLESITTMLADPDRTRSTLDGEGQHLLLAVVRRDTGRLIGDVILFWRSEEHRSGEIGYVLHPDQHGQGFATEASRALLRLAFEELDLHRVVARIDERNPASAAVLRKVGMRQEAVLVENEWFKGEWTTEVDFAILQREWRAQG
ncbi:MAG TPA: GNAT family N-acetyltransferase [Nocardioides sp.]|nr:GNAT family N-acetyltransferase [Nocardioides sp.]